MEDSSKYPNILETFFNIIIRNWNMHHGIFIDCEKSVTFLHLGKYSSILGGM